MIQKLNKNRAGFTLVEIMIVVAIIALLAAIAVPNFLRARKRSQATRILEDLRVIDAAVDQYAIENNKPAGAIANWADMQKYLKAGSPLYNSTGKDLLGNVFGSEHQDGSNEIGQQFQVDGVVHIQTATFEALSDVAPLEFWSPYRIH